MMVPLMDSVSLPTLLIVIVRVNDGTKKESQCTHSLKVQISFSQQRLTRTTTVLVL